ncbi:hypothetical protein AZI86_12755 [Bdellovibrio bacteriovorus]|uniref:Peptidase S1 domain-containing protein n=1 Tax=Bdellovibrio bacteriovorus TaxID=959 RepID=A0A150WJ90_BDEBC|nr:trypsin-like serine protease [Bdellovibrio bacteriovorus]KYG63693.1 hypothetical protein AZI86_12755 [Bdellovibrio bacteriovorus]
MKKMALALGLSVAFSSLNALAIYKGNPVLKNDLIERATFQLVLTDAQIPTLKLPSCTATLISPTVLLTAGHCFGHKKNITYKIAYTNAKGMKVQVPVVKVVIHEGFSEHTVEGFGELVQNDIALVKIANPVTGAIPAQLPSKNWRPQKNQEVLVAGYGVNGHQMTAEEIKESPEGKALIEKSKAHPPKTEAEMLDFVAALMSLTEAKPLLWTKSKASVVERTSWALPMMLLSKGDSVCSGDSGGPSYIRSSSSGLIVVGVHSTTTNGDCVDTRPNWWSSSQAKGYDTLVPLYLDWIRTNIAALSR